MALLNGVRVVLLNASPSLLTAGPAIVGFNDLVSGLAEDGYTYQWVLEANFNSQGIATAREGGSGVYSAGGGTLARNTVWSTLPANAQLTITSTTHIIITPMAQQLSANTVDVNSTPYPVTSEELLLVRTLPATINLPPCANRPRRSILTVKDSIGTAGGSNITIVPNGVETIDGSASAVINQNWGFIQLVPFLATGWGTI